MSVPINSQRPGVPAKDVLGIMIELMHMMLARHDWSCKSLLDDPIMEAIEVQNVELDLAKKRAQHASQAKTEFLANMSHEIRTPMNAVISGTQVLLNDITDKKQLKILKMIDTAGDKLLDPFAVLV